MKNKWRLIKKKCCHFQWLLRSGTTLVMLKLVHHTLSALRFSILMEVSNLGHSFCLYLRPNAVLRLDSHHQLITEKGPKLNLTFKRILKNTVQQWVPHSLCGCC